MMYGRIETKNPLKVTENNMFDSVYSPGRRNFLTISPEELTIGGRIRRERILRKFSIDQLAQYLGISASYLGAIERGKRPVTMNVMEKLHDHLGMSFDFIIEGRSISNAMVSQYVREAPSYNTQHKIDVLLGVCNDSELESCYNLIHTFLTHRRTLGIKNTEIEN